MLDFYREVCGYESDYSAVNELLQTAVSAQPNDEPIAVNPTLVVRCLPKRRSLSKQRFSWKTAVEIIRDGTGPFKKVRLISAGERPVMGRFAVKCNLLGGSVVSCCALVDCGGWHLLGKDLRTNRSRLARGRRRARWQSSRCAERMLWADKLRSRFRTTMLRRLERARAAGKPKLTERHAYLQDDDNWTAFVNEIAAKTWVAYIQPPPTTESQAHHVVNYLTRYLTGGPNRPNQAGMIYWAMAARQVHRVASGTSYATDYEM